ncbi:MAG: transposase [bacterium]|nr:transposase [bacterium]
MFPANSLVNEIVKSTLASAQKHHPVEVSHIIVQSTHVHFTATVVDPNDIRGFMERFKTESAHRINRLLGKKKRTIWCEGYDSTIILDLEKAIEKIVYIYINPIKDGLVESIDHYPGISSWEFLNKQKTTFATYFIPRDAVRKLEDRILSREDYERERRHLLLKKKRTSFKIDINAWMKVFNITDLEEQKEINQKIVEAVREKENEYRENRQFEKKTVLGVTKLLKERPGSTFIPNREGRKTFCISSDKKIRISFIQSIKELISQARSVLLEWRKGNFQTPYPIGLYPPSLPKRAEAFGW